MDGQFPAGTRGRRRRQRPRARPVGRRTA